MPYHFDEDEVLQVIEQHAFAAQRELLGKLGPHGYRHGLGLMLANLLDQPEADSIINATLATLESPWRVVKPKTVDRITGAANTENTGQLRIGRTLEFFRGLKR